MRVLVSAYACEPHAGSEPGGGWNWSVALARAGHRVTVLTLPNTRPQIAAELARHPVPGLEFVHVPAPRWSQRVPGQAGVYVHYLAWQWRAHRVARRRLASDPVDVVHHVSYGSLSLGSLLGRLPVPFVLGPVGGGQCTPPRLRRMYASGWTAEVARRVVVRYLLRLVPTARLAVRDAAVVLVANDETAELAERLGARQTIPMADVGVSADALVPSDVPSGADRLRLLWVGRYYARKGLPLALRAMAALPRDLDVTLRIVGHGPLEAELPAMVARLGVEDRVQLVGRVAHENIAQEYRASDALLFTSLRDSGGVQMLEALSQGCPVIALDHQGAAVILDDAAACKVPVSDVAGTVAGLRDAIVALAEDPERRRRMRAASLELARQHTWEGKADTVGRIYEQVVRDAAR
ncbi:glycosyltransferase family 4 protein [Egicoccus halophilus]|uniref:Uncharacterized protein n=1 Tax=Egicoccus halophilus TaxID=1670830 RepID=A0A8J3ERQ0_9ACTN|nr:glycosyltransferase family 4 protein [Egicoccus halophilus]GGI05440.1 hypothetical protein GCM10011354_14110 [Egicoccus halophilus]